MLRKNQLLSIFRCWFTILPFLSTLFCSQLKIVNHSGSSINIFSLDRNAKDTNNNPKLKLQTPTPIEHERGAILKATDDDEYIIRFHNHIAGVEAFIPKSNSDGTITVKFDKIQSKLIVGGKYRDDIKMEENQLKPTSSSTTTSIGATATTTATAAIPAQTHQRQQEQVGNINIQSTTPKTESITKTATTDTVINDKITRPPKSERVTLKIVNEAGAPIDFFWYDHISSKSDDRKEQKLIIQNAKPIETNGESVITSYPSHAFIIRFHNHIPGVQIDFLKTSIDETITVTYDKIKNKLMSVETHRDVTTNNNSDNINDRNESNNTNNSMNKNDDNSESSLTATNEMEAVPIIQDNQQHAQQEAQTLKAQVQPSQAQAQGQTQILQEVDESLIDKTKLSTPTIKTTTSSSSSSSSTPSSSSSSSTPSSSSSSSMTAKTQERISNKPPQRERAESLSQRKYSTRQAPVSIQQQKLKAAAASSSSSSSSSSSGKSNTIVKNDSNNNHKINKQPEQQPQQQPQEGVMIDKEEEKEEAAVAVAVVQEEEEEDEIQRRLKESDILRLQQELEAKRRQEHDYHHNHHMNSIQKEMENRKKEHSKYRTISHADHKYKVGKATATANSKTTITKNGNSNEENEGELLEIRTFIDRLEDPTMFELFVCVFVIVFVITLIGCIVLYGRPYIWGSNKFKAI